VSSEAQAEASTVRAKHERHLTPPQWCCVSSWQGSLHRVHGPGAWGHRCNSRRYTFTASKIPAAHRHSYRRGFSTTTTLLFHVGGRSRGDEIASRMLRSFRRHWQRYALKRLPKFSDEQLNDFALCYCLSFEDIGGSSSIVWLDQPARLRCCSSSTARDNCGQARLIMPPGAFGRLSPPAR
jgi:hypothetical protein